MLLCQRLMSVWFLHSFWEQKDKTDFCNSVCLFFLSFCCIANIIFCITPLKIHSLLFRNIWLFLINIYFALEARNLRPRFLAKLSVFLRFFYIQLHIVSFLMFHRVFISNWHSSHIYVYIDAIDYLKLPRSIAGHIDAHPSAFSHHLLDAKVIARVDKRRHLNIKIHSLWWDKGWGSVSKFLTEIL